LAEHIDADVAIIGGGLIGTSTALHLAERGVPCVLLEQGCVGWGASGRSAGVVAPMLARGEPEDVIARLGRQAGDRLNSLIGGAGEFVFDLSRRLDLDCDAEQTGFLQPAHAASALPAQRRQYEQWRARGKPVSLLDRQGVAAITGTDAFAGGLIDHSGGQINPLKLTLGLAQAAVVAGARLFENTAALELRQTPDGWRIATPLGSLAAGRVLLATNALAGRLWPQLHRSLMPLTVHQLATRPLDSEAVARILPGRQAATDTSAHPFSFRFDADNRLISAAVSIWPWGADRRLSGAIRRRLARTLKLDEVPEAEFIWSGTAALTRDLLPRLHRLAPGLSAVIGCNGRGIALCTALGPELADLLTDRGDAPPIPETAVEPMPGYWFQRFGPRLYMPLAHWRDARDKASTPAAKALK
jgi:glycine/D-amino acid oxidase-like deaminating enzyme